MNDDLCDFIHNKYDFNYFRDELKVVGKIYTAREVTDRDFEAIIRLLQKNDWKLQVCTLSDGHYIGNGIHSTGPFTTKSMVKTVKKIWKEKKKMNSVFGRIANLIMPKKDLTRGVIGYTDACSPTIVSKDDFKNNKQVLSCNKDKTVEVIVDRGFKNKNEYVIYKKGEK